MGLTGIGYRREVPVWSWPKLAIGYLLGWWLVQTIDHDGEIRLRRLYQRPDGTWWCRRIGTTWCQLCPDGGVMHGSYVQRWRPFLRGSWTFGAPEATDAVDPQAASTGTPTPREKV